MPTFYLDFENGNDANDGTTFANRWKTLTSGATAARIAPGDTVRIMGSPAPTSLGQNGVWTSQALQATKTITGATNATPISITCTGHGYSTGDTVVVESVTTNTNANGTWEITVTGANTFTLDGSVGNGVGSGGTARLRNNTRMMLTTAVTQNIASTGPGRAAWTASANVTATLNTSTFKEHNQADSIAIAAGFTTGLAAYWALPSTTDFSGYQQVSFWIRQTAGTVGAAGAVDLRLCSDNAGVTAVNTISIPNLAVIGRWMPVTVDLGTNLGSSIQSIAFYVNTDNGAQTFLLSNIIACKASSAADSLTLTSLIGKNTTGETFWGIQSINGRRVMLDADTNATPTSTSVRGYYGTSETVTTWKRETIKLGPAASGSTALQTIQDSGSDGNLITFSGGWDRTNMSTQSLETWLDGVNGNGTAIELPVAFISMNSLAFVRFTRAALLNNVANTNCTINFISISNNNIGVDISAATTNLSCTVNAICAGLTGVQALGSGCTGLQLSLPLVRSLGARGLEFNPAIGMSIEINVNNTGSNAISTSASTGTPGNSAIIKNSIFENASSFDASIATLVGPIYFQNCSFLDASEINITTPGTRGTAYVYSHKHDQTTDNHKIFMPGSLISSATDQRHTASGISWKIQPTDTNRSSAWPVTLSLAKVACSANNLVTVKAWMRRDNSGLTMRLVCKGGQIAGVSSDVTATVTTTNAWEELTITFTPTEAGVVEITAEAWGGTTFSGWVDDLTITQA